MILLLVCTVWIIEKGGRDNLYFSRELSADVTVNIMYNNGQSCDLPTVATYPIILKTCTSKDYKC